MPPSSTCFDLLWRPRRLSAYDRFVQGELSTSSSGFDGIYEPAEAACDSVRDAIPRMLCSVFPHIALFHVIKSMLSDETSLEWRFYFKLCIQSFEDLYSLFPVFRTISEGFVSRAIQKDRISGGKARELLERLKKRGRHHQNKGKIT